MRTTSALYKTLRSTIGSYYDVEVINGLKTYTAADLVSIQITSRLLKDEGMSVGNTCSAECKVKLRESSANWARMSSFSVRVRLSSYDGTQKSEWLSMGTYYTDERKEDKYGNLEIIAYDEMLKLEVGWVTVVPEEDIPATFPVTARAMTNLLATHVGFTVDNIDNVDNTLEFVGLDTTLTVREYMSIIASGCGSSWVVTMGNKFRLVPLVNGAVEEEYAIAGIAIAGVAIVGTSSAGIEGYPFFGSDDIGLNAMDLVTSPMFQPISGIIFTADSLEKDQAGDTSGFTLEQQFNFSRSGTAELALTRLNGYAYRPFDTTTALADPAMELGDLLVCNDTKFQTASFTWSVSPHITANVSAPVDAEIDHEYPYLDEAERTYNKLLKLENDYDEAYSSITQDIGQINLEVAQKVGDDEIISKINLSPETIVISANRVDFSGAVTFNDLSTPGHAEITGSNIKGGTLTLGGYDNLDGTMEVYDADGNLTTSIDNDGVVSKSLTANAYIYLDGGENTNSMFRIPVGRTGGSFTVGSFTEISPSHPFLLNLFDGTYYWYYEIVPSYGFSVTTTKFPNKRSWFLESGLKTVDGGEGESSGVFLSNTLVSPSQYFWAGDWGYKTTGQKSRVINNSQLGENNLFCYETPTPMFGDIGEGKLDEDGFCIIDLDPVFSFGSLTKGYQVFLQKYGNGDCWVSERKPGYFVVEGTPGIGFGWEIKAKQSDYSQVRYNDPNAFRNEEIQAEVLNNVFSDVIDIIERSY